MVSYNGTANFMLVDLRDTEIDQEVVEGLEDFNDSLLMLLL